MGLHTLIRSLTAIWEPSWEGALMVALTYIPGQNMDTMPKASVSGSRLLRLSAREGDGRLDMILLLPPHKKERPAAARPSAVKGRFWKVFSCEEIRQAAREAGDRNGIHQGEKPIAGGFLLMDAVTGRFPGHAVYKLRFLSPLYGGEAVYWAQREHGGDAYAAGRLCFQADWEG